MLRLAGLERAAQPSDPYGSLPAATIWLNRVFAETHHAVVELPSRRGVVFIETGRSQKVLPFATHPEVLNSLSLFCSSVFVDEELAIAAPFTVVPKLFASLGVGCYAS